MEARLYWAKLSIAIFLLVASSSDTSAQRPQRGEFVSHSHNFIVFASSPQWAEQVAEVAEKHRRELAIHWLGKELPDWQQRCPLHVRSGPYGAQGETTYMLLRNGTAGAWGMTVIGTPERILDSVLPHEITHTIFASHFARLGKYVPRWADEGACTTVEHEDEKVKHRYHLQKFLKSGHGLAFNTMFRLKEYPDPILPLYAQGHSVVQFLIDQGGPQKFVQFIEAGMSTEQWDKELRTFYQYGSIGELQVSWNQWLADGSPEDLIAYAPSLRSSPEVSLASSQSSNPSEGRLPARAGLASATTSPPDNARMEAVLPGDPISLAAQATGRFDSSQTPSDEGWYQRKLREVSGSPATPVPVHNNFAQSALRPQPAPSSPRASDVAASLQPSANLRPQSLARPQPAQSTGIQVLDWGDSRPIPGIQSPINR